MLRLRNEFRYRGPAPGHTGTSAARVAQVLETLTRKGDGWDVEESGAPPQRARGSRSLPSVRNVHP